MHKIGGIDIWDNGALLIAEFTNIVYIIYFPIINHNPIAKIAPTINRVQCFYSELYNEWTSERDKRESLIINNRSVIDLRSLIDHKAFDNRALSNDRTTNSDQ